MRFPVKKNLLYFALFWMIASTCQGRITKLWTYDDLFAQSDAIVIGKLVSNERVDNAAPKELSNVPLIAEKVTFQIISTIKGEGAKTLSFINYRLMPNKIVMNGPNLMTFRKDAVKVDFVHKDNLDKEPGSIPAPYYIIFLYKESDGNFRPVTGFYDARYSFREIIPPLPADAIDDN